MLIYRLLNYFSSISVTICLIASAYYIWYAIKSLAKHENLSFANWINIINLNVQSFAGKYTKMLLVISLLATLITNTALHQIVGIHNLQIKPEGTYCFYVEARRSGGKTYTLPAQVRVEKETVEVSDSKSKTFTHYYIEKVFFSNGGWLDTDDSEPDTINKPSYFCDSNDDEWSLVLLNEHAYSPHATETNNAGWFNISFMLIEVLSISFMLYALCNSKEPKES